MTAQEIEQSGFEAEDFASDIAEVWPENQEACELFCSLSTQWRMGPSGATGLDYNVLYLDLDRMALTPFEYGHMKAKVQIIERAALECMHKKRP